MSNPAAIITANTAFTTVATTNQTTITTPTQGNLMLVFCYNNADNAMTISDSASGSWTSALGGDYAFGAATPNRALDVWYKAAAGTETWVKVTTSSGSLSIIYNEVQNVAAVVDNWEVNQLSSNGTSVGTNSITTANANDFIYLAAAVGGNQTGTKTFTGSGFTEHDNKNEASSGANSWDAYGLTTATGTYSATATYPASAESAAVIVAFSSFSRVKSVNNESTTDTYSANGTYYWTPPTGTTVAQVQLWGAGGGGGAGAAGAGGGGQFAQSVLPVTSIKYGGTSGTAIPIVVGLGGGGGAGGSAGAVAGTNGGDSTFNSTSVVAKGGSGAPASTSGGAGGTGGTGAILYIGGAGGTGDGAAPGAGGGGGGSGGTAAVGIPGGNASGTTGGTAATAVTGGGPGGAGSSSTGITPASGPGGGGGGGGYFQNIHSLWVGDAGGNGYDGQAIITYPSDSSNFIPFLK
jgi:hypothetical protein